MRGEEKDLQEISVFCASAQRPWRGGKRAPPATPMHYGNVTISSQRRSDPKGRRVRERKTHEKTSSTLGVATEVAGGEGEGGRVDDRLAPEDEEKGSDAGLAAGDSGDEREDRGHATVTDQDQRSREELEQGRGGDTLQQKRSRREHKV